MPPEPRQRVAIPGAVRALRWVLYGLLLLAAAGALLGLPRAARAGWPSALRLVPVWILLAFVGGYAAYRFALVRQGRYSAGKAMVQIAVMLLAAGVIASISLEAPRARPALPPVDLAAPLASPDPEVRALAAEVVRHRPREEALRHLERLVALLDDESPQVRGEAHAALVALAGTDAGEGPGAAGTWRALWQERGRLPAAP
jgi:hypothetical protein